MIAKFLEYKSSGDFDAIKSFYLQDDLNPKFWKEFEINEDTREDLLQIANDFIEHLDLGDIEIEDIVLTGSLANYNWSEYSDFDLHVVFDFSQINEDEVLVKKYLDAAKSLWNEQHDLLLDGFEVELYSQNSSEKHIASGQFSLLNDKWIKKPSKENFEPDEELIKLKSETIIDKIDDIESDFKNGLEYDEISEKLNKVWKKIKDNRQKGLDKEGEYSTENLVFKLLRRNGYITKILDLKTKIYDKQFK